VVLAVGASLNDFTMMNGTLLSQKCLILRCDVKPEPTGNLVQEQLLAIGDAGVTVKELLRELESRGKTSVGYRPRAAETLSSYRPEDEFFEVTDEPGAVDPRSLTLALDRALPASRTVVTDAGHFFGFPVAYMNAEDGRAFLCSIDFGSIGLGIGMAFGASQARPENTTVLFIGDGGLLMSLGDLETLARYDVPMLVVVFNDAAYGSELQIIRMWGLKEDFSVFPRTDFAAVAESLGVRAIRVSSKEDVEALASQLSNGEISGLTLVDCSISRDVRAAWLEEAFRH
jgi:thiamine pyrophosphate-dependent acetolactate synthase large subunit-like protein